MAKPEIDMSKMIDADMRDPEVFKYWSELGQSDPAAFERLRAAAIERARATGSSERQREDGKRIQREADARRASNRMESAALAFNEMSESSKALGAAWDQLHNMSDEFTQNSRPTAYLLKNGFSTQAPGESGEEHMLGLFKKKE